MRNEKGFTLIEIVMVIVLLGILAAVAIPRYIDLQTEAEVATANGIYAAAKSAAVINFAANMAGKNLTPVTDDTSLLGAMDSTPDGCVNDNNATLVCTINGTAYTISITAPGETATNAAGLTKSW